MKDEISISAAARLLGLDRRTVTRIVERLQPTGTHRGNALFRLSDVVREIIAGRQPAHGDITMDEARRRRAIAEMVIAEAEARRIEGSTIAIADAVGPLAEQCQTIRGKFLGLATRVAPRVIGHDVQSAHAVIYNETCTILRELTADAEAVLQADRAKATAKPAANGSAEPEDDK